jgi:hypothetical protein
LVAGTCSKLLELPPQADPRNFLLFLVLIAEELYLAADRGSRNEIIRAFWQLVAAGLFASPSNCEDARFTVLSS